MPRQPRYVLPGQPQHIIQRGNNRCDIFRADEDYHRYLSWLDDSCKKHRCDIHAYVLMTNHVHLLATPHNLNSISKTLQSLGRRYVRYFNRKYDRTGTLWEDRYKSTLIDSDRYLLTCYRYIELNPVRAGLAKHPADYYWSSYRFHAQGKANFLIRDHGLFMELGISEQERQRQYKTLFEANLDDKTLDSIRKATNKAWVLGTENFKARVEAALDRKVRPFPKKTRRKPKGVGVI
jgi:putative transposase